MYLCGCNSKRYEFNKADSKRAIDASKFHRRVCLPHTKMLIRMPFVIDYSNIHKMTDFLKNVPQIECEDSITNFLKNYNSKYPYSLEALLQDRCFLKAISL